MPAPSQRPPAQLVRETAGVNPHWLVVQLAGLQVVPIGHWVARLHWTHVPALVHTPSEHAVFTSFFGYVQVPPAEGQVGVKRSDGGFSYQATVSKIDVGYGESVLFLPLGLRSPLRIEIAVFRAADLPTQDGTPAAGAAAQKTGR